MLSFLSVQNFVICLRRHTRLPTNRAGCRGLVPREPFIYTIGVIGVKAGCNRGRDGREVFHANGARFRLASIFSHQPRNAPRNGLCMRRRNRHRHRHGHQQRRYNRCANCPQDMVSFIIQRSCIRTCEFTRIVETRWPFSIRPAQKADDRDYRRSRHQVISESLTPLFKNCLAICTNRQGASRRLLLPRPMQGEIRKIHHGSLPIARSLVPFQHEIHPFSWSEECDASACEILNTINVHSGGLYLTTMGESFFNLETPR